MSWRCMPWRILLGCGVDVHLCIMGLKVRCCTAMCMCTYAMSVLNRSRLAGRQHADMEGGGTCTTSLPHPGRVSTKDTQISVSELPMTLPSLVTLLEHQAWWWHGWAGRQWENEGASNM